MLGLKYKDGVMLAADNLGTFTFLLEVNPITGCDTASYGTLARFRDIQRLHPLGNHTVLAVAGDMSDYQYLKRDLDSILCAPPFPFVM